MSATDQPTRLADQIMDELTDRPGSYGDLAKTLGAHYETVKSTVRRLEGQGLVYASHTKAPEDRRGPAEIVWDMVRTRRPA